MATLISPRRIRVLLVHSRRWQRRAIFIAGGLAVGLAAVGLAVASDQMQALFHQLAARWRYLPLVLTPVGFGVAVFLTRYFPNTQGSGIPQAIAARGLKRDAQRSQLVGLRFAVGKVLLTLLGLAVGASTGREGPTVQVGASIMFLIGRMTRRHQPGLILAGAAAGVAAAFNTPLAGIVFAIEEMSRSFEVRASGLIIAAVILAGLTAQALLGNYTYFGTSSAALPIGTAWMAVPLCGIIGGFSGAAFSRILVAIPDAMPRRLADAVREQPVIFAMLCGYGVALCGYASDGAIFGTGYEQARAVLHHTGVVPLDYAPLKLLATALSAVSEMSGDHGMLVALMATAFIADACARLINREGVYHQLAKRFAAPQG